MPRQDVPYGGAICRLKERIAEIWDKLDEKLHSINGVEGDGAGNVEIVSGDAAVVINNDQIGHRIEVALDSSKLPAAAVSSVNWQTGAVRLDAADVPSVGNSNVQLDINWCKTAINDCFDSITTEQDDRQAADAELQGNINSVQASIPGAAAAAVSNDPTVAQLAADVPGKLDKISSGSTLKAYTHTGQAQGETAVVNGIDANSIGLRDANGRMQAADPAAGATDKTLVTANWVSQTGDDGPNNLIHRNGNETKNGVFSVNYPITGTAAIKITEYSSALTIGMYRLVFKILKTSVLTYFRDTIIFVEIGRESPDKGLTYIIVSIHAGNANGLNVFNVGRTNSDSIRYVLSYDDDYVYLWRSNLSSGGISANSFILFENLNSAIIKPYPNIIGGTIADDSNNYIGTLITEKSI